MKQKAQISTTRTLAFLASTALGLLTLILIKLLWLKALLLIYAALWIYVSALYNPSERFKIKAMATLSLPWLIIFLGVIALNLTMLLSSPMTFVILIAFASIPTMGMALLCYSIRHDWRKLDPTKPVKRQAAIDPESW